MAKKGIYTGKESGHIFMRALIMATSMLIIIAFLQYFNFDFRFGVGISAIAFAAFGASAFLLFMTPDLASADRMRFVKSYVIATILGAIGYFMSTMLNIYLVLLLVTFAAAILLVKTDSIHPPAVALLVAFILYKISYMGAAVVAVGIIILLALKLISDRPMKIGK